MPPLVAPSPPVPARGVDGAAPDEVAREHVITESRERRRARRRRRTAARSVATPPPAARAARGAWHRQGCRIERAGRARDGVGERRAAQGSGRRSGGAPKPAAASNAESERAQALLEGRPVAAADTLRFVVQVGAFADAEAARATRQKIEKLGLKTYTQVAQTSGGSRIRVRVGPFATREEADAALAKAKAAGLDAVVLTL